MNLINAARTLGLWLDPLRQALFAPGIPFSLRWRLLIVQQINLLVLPIKTLPWAFSGTYRTIWIPSREKHQIRALVFEPARKSKPGGLPPLHIDFHAGAFAGGVAEIDLDFCHEVCRKTGAVVASVDYRVAPQHVFPAAHNDCEDAIAWLSANARQGLGADPDCLTVSGFSAGGNAMFIAGSQARAAVGFYSAIDLRLAPWEKPKPPNFPDKDPFEVLLPLYDSYAGPVRQSNIQDARLSPIIKPLTDLPKIILLIIPAIDICVHEQLTFVERVKKEIGDAGSEGERMPWLPRDLYAEKIKAQELAIDFIAKAQQRQD